MSPFIFPCKWAKVHRFLKRTFKTLPIYFHIIEPRTTPLSRHCFITFPFIIIIVINCFYVALFPALKQTHCTLVTCNSEWVTAVSAFLKIHWSGVLTALLSLLHGWCHMKLLLSLCIFCVRHTTMHHFTVSLHLKPHTWGACVFSCNLPPAPFWQNDWDLLHASVVTRGGTNTKIRIGTESWFQRRKFSCHSCRDSNLQPFDHNSGAVPLSYHCFPYFHANEPRTTSLLRPRCFFKTFPSYFHANEPRTTSLLRPIFFL